MTKADESGVRLTGVRHRYEDAPEAVRTWAATVLGGPPAQVIQRTGGMSPAVAVSLRAANGRAVFVKAVGGAVNPDTPTHFRHEIEVLSALPPAPYRAGLVSTYDDGDWVGIALDDVDGDHPDWGSKADREVVEAAVLEQMSELAPAPPGVTTMSTRTVLERYLETMRSPTPGELRGLPGWAVERLPELVDATAGCLAHHRDEALCHYDIRHDNILIRRRDRQPFLLDWGMSRLGQRWTDLMVYATEWAASPRFDAVVARAAPSEAESREVTGYLAGIGTFLCMVATHPAPPGLPTLPAFRAELGAACLVGARRRLDDAGTGELDASAGPGA